MTPWHLMPVPSPVATYALCHPSKSLPLWGEITSGRINTLNSEIRKLFGIAG